MTDVCAPDTYMYTQTSLSETHTEDPGRTLLRVDQWWGFPSEDAVSVSYPQRHPLGHGVSYMWFSSCLLSSYSDTFI